MCISGKCSLLIVSPEQATGLTAEQELSCSAAGPCSVPRVGCSQEGACTGRSGWPLSPALFSVKGPVCRCACLLVSGNYGNHMLDQKSLRGLRKSNNINMVDRWKNDKLYTEYQVDDKEGAPIEWGRKQ